MEDLARQPNRCMKKKQKRILEFSFAGLFLIILLSIGIPSLINNVKQARIEASYLEAKAFYEEYLNTFNLDSLEEGQFIFYNDGHLYWKINDQGEIFEDPDHNEKTEMKMEEEK